MNDIKGIIEDCNKSDLVSNKIIKKIIEIIGQEEWQDLHDENNDICTTMGELIITLKGIADLEKENAELKEKLGDVQMQKAGEKSDLVWKLKTANEQKADQLTKAKEIIKNLLILKNDHYGNTKMEWRVKVTEQAEQFLNSEVEK